MRNNAPLKEPQIRLFISPVRFLPDVSDVKSSGGEIGEPGAYIKIREIEKRIIRTIVSLLPILTLSRSVLNSGKQRREITVGTARYADGIPGFSAPRYCAIAFVIHTYQYRRISCRRINSTANYSVEIVLIPLSIVPNRNTGKYVIAKPHIVYQHFDKVD